MRNPIILLPVLSLFALSWPLAAARAQVTVDLRALDALPHAGPAPAPRPTVPAARPVAPRSSVQAEPATPAPPASPSAAPSAAPAQQAGVAAAAGTSTPAPAASRPAPPTVASAPAAPPPARESPALPTQAPAVANLAPVPPPANLGPPPAPPVSATADTHANASPTGLRVSFDPAGTELSPSSVAAIRQFASAAPGSDPTYNVLAYASGSPNDPSAARRLSLTRALAVRAALMADGVASSRIFVRALGSPTDNSPPDRVDIGRLGTNASAAKSP